MVFDPGTILEGTVRSIAGFGAFIALPEGQTGLVHISEVAPVYVRDIRQHLTEGQTVRVKVLGTDGKGRFRLSVKQTEQVPATPAPAKEPAPISDSFEDKLKQFMAASNDRIAGVRQYEHRTRSRKR